MRLRPVTPLILLALLAVVARADVASVSATLETRSHFDDASGHNTDVDDPAIWIHPQDPGRSLIAATLKEGGLDVYTLDGKLLQHLPASPPPPCADDQPDCADNAPGRLNNVEVVYGFALDGESVDLVVASDRGRDRLVIYRIAPNPQGQHLLSDITDPAAGPIFSSSQQAINNGFTAYGLATYQDQGKTLALVSQNSTTRLALLQLEPTPLGQVSYSLQAMLDFPHRFPAGTAQWTPCADDNTDRPQFEGMVADPEHNALYLAQENVGLWRIALDAPRDASRWRLFARAREFGVPYRRVWSDAEQEYGCTLQFDRDPGLGDSHLHVDLEGLTVYDAGEGRGYLLVSSQGDNSVAVYDRGNDNRYHGSFRVGAGVVDGVDETDGMMVTSTALGSAFPAGLLVMQDGENLPAVYNADGQARESSNFKFVDWRAVAEVLELSPHREPHPR